MYPLNMQLVAPAVGFALANDEAEHTALNALGYAPLLVAKVLISHDDLMALAESKGIKVDKRWSTARLQSEIEKA